MFSAVIRTMLAACYRVDVALTRWLNNRRGSTLYELRGACVSCGACCVTPMLAVSRVVYHSTLIRHSYLWWQETVNGFVFLRAEHEGHVFVFRCKHFDRATRLCDCYRTRPGICRDYPNNLLDSPNPEFLEGCGYYPHYCNADAFKEALDEHDLAPEKRAEIERKLHLRD
jgi:Fe-S-cluster containining protein